LTVKEIDERCIVYWERNEDGGWWETLETLVQHFPVDTDALAVAAVLSQAVTPNRISLTASLETLSVSEMRAMLARVAEGGGSRVMAELNRMTYPRQAPVSPALRCIDFAAKAIQAREMRQKQEAAAAAATRRHDAKLRRQHVASVMQRADNLWPGLDLLMDQKIASAYEQAATQLKELRDAYAQAGDLGSFQQKLAGFRLRYSNRPAMLRRIENL
jgi:hypothetical protein